MEEIWIFIKELLTNAAVRKGILIILTIIGMIVCFAANRKIFYKVGKKLDEQETTGRNKQVKTIAKLGRSVVRALIWIIGIMIILSMFVDISSVMTVAGAGTLVLGLGAQSIISDFFAGIMILLDRQFFVGDFICLDREQQEYGTVEDIGVLSTRVRLKNDQGVLNVHNAEIRKVINYSRGGRLHPVIIGVAYNTDLQRALGVLNAVSQRLHNTKRELFPELPSVVGVMDYEASAISLRVDLLVKGSDTVMAESMFRKAVLDAFETEGVEIPYDQLVIHRAEI